MKKVTVKRVEVWQARPTYIYYTDDINVLTMFCIPSHKLEEVPRRNLDALLEECLHELEGLEIKIEFVNEWWDDLYSFDSKVTHPFKDEQVDLTSLSFRNVVSRNDLLRTQKGYEIQIQTQKSYLKELELRRDLVISMIKSDSSQTWLSDPLSDLEYLNDC